MADATTVSPSPGEVVVTVLSGAGARGAIGRGPERGKHRAQADQVTVRAATPVDFAIEAERYVFAGPDQTLILGTALAALDAYLVDMRRLDRDIARSAIISALHVGTSSG